MCVVFRRRPGEGALDFVFQSRDREWTRAIQILQDAPSFDGAPRSEEHTSKLQSLRHLVCRLLLEKKKKKRTEKQLLNFTLDNMSEGNPSSFDKSNSELDSMDTRGSRFKNCHTNTHAALM